MTISESTSDEPEGSQPCEGCFCGEIGIRLKMEEYGWAKLYLRLVGAVKVNIDLSNVFDPFFELVEWGRGIEEGELPIQMEINEEGRSAVLTVSQSKKNPECVLLRVSWIHICPDKRLLLESTVARSTLAATLKAELRRFFTTEFDPTHWDLLGDPFDFDDDYVQVKDWVLNHPWLREAKPNSENATSVPTLTVKLRRNRFLWSTNTPDLDIGMAIPSWDESCPMSEELWHKFEDWAVEYNRIDFYSDTPEANNWDWIAFHARSLQLSRWLKEEVGDAYHVVYEKPIEDPNHCINRRTEILMNGELLSLPDRVLSPEVSRFFAKKFLRFCERIVSGGQTGTDRAALDFAIRHDYLHGGWAPHGRKAEDGIIPLKYQLTELPNGGYRQRTRRNVEDSDGTLIVNLGELDGGTLATQTFAQQAGKPHLVVQLDDEVTAVAAARVRRMSELFAANVLAWLRARAIKTLNVAGPCESKRPGIYRLTGELLYVIDVMLYQS